MQNTGEKWVLIGATNGLGFSLAQWLMENQNVAAENILVIGRSTMPNSTIPFYPCDLSNSDNWPSLIERIMQFSAQRIIYFAGGGPFGHYGDKDFKDHQWAWNVTYMAFAYLLHAMLKKKSSTAATPSVAVRQIIAIGSAVAERAADPGAASYSAAKHALKGLIQSVQIELAQVTSVKSTLDASGSVALDLRLFSPGYMQTGMLPMQAWPYQFPNMVKDSSHVASELGEWALNPNEHGKNRVLAVYPKS